MSRPLTLAAHRAPAIAATLCGVLTFSANPARADEATARPTSSSTSSEPDAWPEAIPRVEWWEWAGSVALLGGSLALRFGVDVSGEPNWKGGILFDEAAHDAFFVDSPHLFNSWRDLGDILYMSSFGWSVVDPLIAGFTNDWDTALQMTGMNLEAFAIYSASISLAQLAVRRERPTTRLCSDPTLSDDLGISCGEDSANKNRSFIGGHAGTAATAATLTCIHHAELDLWGPQADALPCVTMWLSTATVFVSRTVTAQHYLTDNLLGVGVGVASGIVPYFLHYHRANPFPTVDASDGIPRPTSAMITPTTHGAMVQLGGLL